MQIDINISNSADLSYPIYINELESLEFDSKVAIVTNPKVAGLHLEKILSKIKARELYIVTVPDGEEYKNQKSIDTIIETLFNHKFNRKDKLIAFGGGVIGDMTGFASSIYQRGIDFIQVPTTLLSQVDASVGGKTGINNRFGKNLIGAFHQPIAVYIESNFLKTLPKREFGAGVAEIVKMAVTFDKDFFRWLESSDLRKNDDLQEAIAKSVKTKASVVSQDEKEKGVRAVLNYGHTFAHVIENLTNYSTYLHGEAVAIGICMANRLSVALDLMSETEAKSIERLLLRYNLPISFDIKDLEDFYDHFSLDKKAQNQKIKFILASGIGDYIIKDDIEKNIVMKILK
jgi:3-dehydroquinate synthase